MEKLKLTCDACKSEIVATEKQYDDAIQHAKDNGFGDAKSLTIVCPDCYGKIMARTNIVRRAMRASPN